jgi:hypothetical protein
LFGGGAEYHRVIEGPGVLHVISPQDGPLSGTLALSAEPLRPLGEGLGESVIVPPGGTAAFAFSLQKTATIGIGVRAEPDAAQVRVFDASGKLVGEGVAQLLPNLPAGHYVVEARCGQRCSARCRALRVRRRMSFGPILKRLVSSLWVIHDRKSKQGRLF